MPYLNNNNSVHIQKEYYDLNNELLKELENRLTTNELLLCSKSIYREYNIFYSDTQLWSKINHVFGIEYSELFGQYKDKVLANTFINNIVFKYYPNEIYVKYHLIKDWISKYNETMLFEFTSGSSRVDLCRINGKSNAYEIKTEFDDFYRLSKQLNDYAKLFEYVYIVIPKKNWISIVDKIPDYCGVILYSVSESGDFKRWTKKKAQKSPHLSNLDQVKVMNTMELQYLLKKIGHIIPSSRKEREIIILEKFNAEQINIMFKETIKNKYKTQSEYIRSNFNNIIPIDIQTFYHKPINLRLAYRKDSLTVNI